MPQNGQSKNSGLPLRPKAQGFTEVPQKWNRANGISTYLRDSPTLFFTGGRLLKKKVITLGQENGRKDGWMEESATQTGTERVKWKRLAVFWWSSWVSNVQSSKSSQSVKMAGWTGKMDWVAGFGWYAKGNARVTQTHIGHFGGLISLKLPKRANVKKKREKS